MLSYAYLNIVYIDVRRADNVSFYFPGILFKE